MTLLGTLALRYTLRARVGSDAFTRSPSSSEHSNYNTNKFRPYSGLLMVAPVVKFSVLMSSITLIQQAYLVLLQPFLQQLLAALLQDRPAQLQRLKLVELTLVQQNPKVLQQWGGLTWLSWDALELTNGLCSAQNSLRGGKDGRKNDLRMVTVTCGITIKHTLGAEAATFAASE